MTWHFKQALVTTLTLGLGLVTTLDATATKPLARSHSAVSKPSAGPIASSEEEGPTIQLSVAKERIHHAKPQACEVWVDPERGFVDSCDPPQAAQGEKTLEVITLDKGEWLEAMPESEEGTASEPFTAEIPQTALEALPGVITTLAEPILDIITLEKDEDEASQTPDVSEASPVQTVVNQVSQAVETLAKAVLATPSQRSTEPPQATGEAYSATPTAPQTEATAEPLIQPSQPLEPIALNLEAPSVMIAQAVSATEPQQAMETSQERPTSPAVTVAPPSEAPQLQNEPKTSSSEASTQTETQKNSWRYRHQSKPQYNWPKNPVSQVLKRVVGFIHWIFG